MRLVSIRLSIILVVLFVSCRAVAAEAPVLHAPPDVRVLLDVSGSMDQLDPNNLRSEAVSLLLRSLPDNAKGGVWVFANAAQPLVPYGATDLFWRRLASIHARDLPGRGQRSNLLAALEAVTWDAQEPSAHPRHIILLSDGKVDVAADEQTNAAARETLLKRYLPQLAESDIKVHAVVVSGQADTRLLQQLAAQTGGFYLPAATPRQLANQFQRVLDRTVRPSYLPVVGQSFTVEPGLAEITLWRAGDEKGLELQQPDGRVLTRSTPGVQVQWHDASGFDVLTIRDPQPGTWSFSGEFDGRILAYSDVQVASSDVPATLFPGKLSHVDFMLFADGQPVTDASFLSTVQSAASLEGAKSTTPLFTERIPSGQFRAYLVDLYDAGPYVLRLALTNPTFARELAVPFELANPVQITVETEGKEVILRAQLAAPEVDYGHLLVAAQLSKPPAPKRLLPAQSFPGGYWQVRDVMARGNLEATFTFSGNYLNQKEFVLKTAPLRVNLPLDEPQTFVFDTRGRAVKKPKPEPQAPVVATVENSSGTPQENPEPTIVTVPEEPQLPTLPLLFVGLITLLNLLFLAALWWFMRRPPPPDNVVALLIEAQSGADSEQPKASDGDQVDEPGQTADSEPQEPAEKEQAA